jgi:hypothetical protein
LGGPQDQALETYENSHSLTAENDSHNVSQDSMNIKCNFRPRNRGSPILLGGIVGGLAILEKNDSKPSQRGNKSLISIAKKQSNSEVKSGK